MTRNIGENGLFCIIADSKSKILSKEELKEMHLDGLISLMYEKIKRMDYLQDDDKRMLLFLIRSIKEQSGIRDN